MRRFRIALLIGALGWQPIAAFALSTPIGRDVNFPKDYDPLKAKALRAVIQDEQFKFVGGIVSWWPPDFGTRLSFDGDTDSLNKFLDALRELPGSSLRFVRYQGRNDELRRDSPWQLDFSQARPEQLTIYWNEKAASLDFKKIKLPESASKTAPEK